MAPRRGEGGGVLLGHKETLIARTFYFGGYPFEYVCDIEPQRNQAGAVFLYWPQSRYGNQKGLELHSDGKGPFCRFRISENLPHKGVYAVLVNGDVRYVGRCIHLLKRFNQGYGVISPRNCFLGGQMTNCRVNRLILEAATRGDKIELGFFETEDGEEVERRLLIPPAPPWNKQGNP